MSREIRFSIYAVSPYLQLEIPCQTEKEVTKQLKLLKALQTNLATERIKRKVGRWPYIKDDFKEVLSDKANGLKIKIVNHAFEAKNGMSTPLLLYENGFNFLNKTNKT